MQGHQERGNEIILTHRANLRTCPPLNFKYKAMHPLLKAFAKVRAENFNLVSQRQKVLTRMIAEKGTMSGSEHVAVQALGNMLEKAMKAPVYGGMLKAWLTNGDTLLLREISKDAGYDYWNNLTHANAIDFLDSSSLAEENWKLAE